SLREGATPASKTPYTAPDAHEDARRLTDPRRDLPYLSAVSAVPLVPALRVRTMKSGEAVEIGEESRKCPRQARGWCLEWSGGKSNPYGPALVVSCEFEGSFQLAWTTCVHGPAILDPPTAWAGLPGHDSRPFGG